MIDNYHYIIIQTYKNGVARVLSRSDSKEDIEDSLLYLCRVYSEEIANQEFRLDIYEG